MYTKVFLETLTSFVAFFVAGLLLSTPILVYVGLVPLFFAILGIVLNQPKTVIFDRGEHKTESFTGDVIEVAIDVTIKDGLGPVIIGDELPPHFELVEGNNFKVIWKGMSEKKDNVNYKVRCTKRGIYTLEHLNWESNHILNFKETIRGESDQKQTLTVRPRTLDIRRIRNLKTIAKLPIPLGAMNKTGMSTTDFQEIRKYTFGDTFRSINWKATARRANNLSWEPYVNEYEKEGKKVVWLFIDGSKAMGQLGTTISNPFEYALLAANDLAHYYLERNCRVGFYLFNKKSRLLYPDIGRSQQYKISRELLTMTMDNEEPLRKAVEKCRKYMIGSNPLCIVITTLAERMNSDELSNIIEGVKEIAKYSKKQTRNFPPILLINVLGYYFIANSPEKRMAADILQSEETPIKRKLRKSGTIVIDWDPTEEKLMTVLLKEVRSR